MTEILREPVDSPASWLGADIANSSDWTVELRALKNKAVLHARKRRRLSAG